MRHWKTETEHLGMYSFAQVRNQFCASSATSSSRCETFCFAQDAAQQQAANEMFRRLVQAEKKHKVVKVIENDGTVRWGSAVNVSPTGFTLSMPSARGIDMEVSLNYDQVRSVHYETGRNIFIRHFVNTVTAPIWVPVFIVWGLQGNRC
jgi:hypothetical protein